MKRLVTTAFFLLSLSAHASVGVAFGHHTWDADGFPVLGKGEQVKVFHCSGTGDGRALMGCALDKCMRHYKLGDSDRKELRGDTPLFGGVCVPDGWSERKGHVLVMVGPKGDNQSLWSKSLGSPTREEAMRFVCSNGFPCDRAQIVLDFFDYTGRDLPPPPSKR